MEQVLAITDPARLRAVADLFAADQRCAVRAFLDIRRDERSVPVADLRAALPGLVQAGVREAVLVGDVIAAYRDGDTTLAGLIRALLDAEPHVARVRLGALDPAHLDTAFYDLAASEPRLAADFVLRLDLDAGLDGADGAVRELLDARPQATFAIDLDIGEPIATDETFAAVLDAIKRWRVLRADIHARRGASAASDDVLKRRIERVQAVIREQAETHRERLAGKVHAVLMESDAFGRSESFQPVRLAKPVAAGQVAQVAVTTVKDGQLLGSAMGDYTTAEGDSAGGWLKKLRTGLGKSSKQMTAGIGSVFSARRRLDDAALEELEEALIVADLGVATAAKLTAQLAKTRFDQELGSDEVREAFAEHIAKILDPVAKPLMIDAVLKPHVILVCGVNGSGKTTTIGKLAKRFVDEGRSVMLAAGDTFRAAAIEQLQVWGERIGAPVIARDIGADAAGLAFDAVSGARAQGVDVLLIDTAGRLQNKTHLMEELDKIVRVIKKVDADAPHDVLLVLDSTVGQNAHSQVEAFKNTVAVTGLVMTKLDGTAKGGVVVALADKFKLPVHAIGVGEGADDLRPFDPKDFARSLMGLN